VRAGYRIQSDLLIALFMRLPCLVVSYAIDGIELRGAFRQMGAEFFLPLFSCTVTKRGKFEHVILGAKQGSAHTKLLVVWSGGPAWDTLLIRCTAAGEQQ